MAYKKRYSFDSEQSAIRVGMEWFLKDQGF
jgi:hypothetical protein